MVSQADRLMSPQMHKSVPKPEMVLIMLITGRWCPGMGILLRLSHTRSPNTALDAQFFVEPGIAKTRGLIHIQTIESKIGTSDHRPIQIRLQAERIKTGKAK